tara:strand:- start:541 stop:1239 length:699 start_codon:yes stop_codon:yes gene_type:complete
MDWAHDDVLRYTLDAMIRRGLLATWFVTHDTPLISELCAAGHEVGLHPNFNDLLSGDKTEGDAEDILANLLNIVPRAKCVRSHSLLQSSRLAALFVRHGFTHDANTFLPFDQLGLLSPWRGPSGLVHVSHGWEDDVFLSDVVDCPLPHEALDMDGVFVFDFHPIHYYLNPIDYDDYEICRGHLDDVTFLASHARKPGSGGVADHLNELFDKLDDRGISCTRLVDLEPVMQSR